MNKEFIPYEQALELKELGYDIPSISSEHGHVWEREILYQQAFRWFRDKYEIFSCIMTEYSYGGHISAYHINGKRQSSISKGDFATYEEAELACLRKLIEIVKNK